MDIPPPLDDRQTDPSGPGPVLLVEDSPLVLKIARLILERAGYAVVTATDGRSAVDAFRTHAAELSAVVLDMGLPELTGQEVLVAMHAARPDVPVIVASGFTPGEAAEHFAGLSVASFIQKPYKPQLLIRALSAVVRD